MLVLVICGCGGGGGTTPPSEGNLQPTITSISVSPTAPSLIVGQAQQLVATALYSDGSTKNITAAATWSSSNIGVATVSAGGLVTGVTAGQVNVSAASSGKTGSDAITISAKAQTLTSIQVFPANATLAVGISQQFSAIGTFSDGSTSDLTSTAAWSVSVPGLASVSNSGTVTTVAQGSMSIVASAGGVQGSSPLTIPNSNGGLVLNTNQTDALPFGHRCDRIRHAAMPTGGVA